MRIIISNNLNNSGKIGNNIIFPFSFNKAFFFKILNVWTFFPMYGNTLTA